MAAPHPESILPKSGKVTSQPTPSNLKAAGAATCAGHRLFAFRGVLAIQAFASGTIHADKNTKTIEEMS
jgi:hypothetical protein